MFLSLCVSLAPCCMRSHPSHISSSCVCCKICSPTPLIVTSCSAPRQHAPLTVLLLHRLHTPRTAAPYHDDRLLLRSASSHPAAFLISTIKEEVQLMRLSGPTKRRRRRRHLPYNHTSAYVDTEYVIYANLAYTTHSHTPYCTGKIGVDA